MTQTDTRQATSGMWEVNLAKMGPFLKKANITVLSWTTASGAPMSTPVWYKYEGGKFLVHSMHPTGKTRAIQRSDAVALCIQGPEPPYRYVTVAGRAKLVIDADACPPAAEVPGARLLRARRRELRLDRFVENARISGVCRVAGVRKILFVLVLIVALIDSPG